MTYDNTPTVNVVVINVIRNPGNHIRSRWLGMVAVQRADNKGWAFPGGFQERPEQVRDGTVREIREEIGLELDPTSLSLYDIRTVPDGSVNLAFWITKIDEDTWFKTSTTFVPNDEVLAVELKTDLWKSIFPMHTKVAEDIWFWEN